jgi:maltose O-acetyltransferase
LVNQVFCGIQSENVNLQVKENRKCSGVIKKVIWFICILLYYGFARYFPTQPAPGYNIGYKIKRILVKGIFKECGIDVVIKSKAYFGKGNKIIIGDRSELGDNCKVESDLVLGRDVLMGPDVVIQSTAHQFERLDIPVNQQGFKPGKNVVIGDDVWIGTRAVILPGIKIGDQAVIGAGSIVTKDIPPRAIVGGSPAKVIRYRGDRI